MGLPPPLMSIELIILSFSGLGSHVVGVTRVRRLGNHLLADSLSSFAFSPNHQISPMIKSHRASISANCCSLNHLQGERRVATGQVAAGEGRDQLKAFTSFAGNTFNGTVNNTSSD